MDYKLIVLYLRNIFIFLLTLDIYTAGGHIQRYNNRLAKALPKVSCQMLSECAAETENDLQQSPFIPDLYVQRNKNVQKMCGL